jgi:excisionase family DNA binding protein
MNDFNQFNERLRNIESLLLTQKTVLNFDEVAAYTGLSKSYLYKLTSTGGIPCYKPQGKQIYCSRIELDGWLLQNRKATKDEIESEASTFVTLKKGVKNVR